MDPRTFTSCPGSTFQYHFSPLCLLKNFTPFLIFTICFNHQRTQTPENIMPSLCCILLLVSTNCPHPYFYLSCVLCLVAQSCLTLCDPMDCNSPGSSVHGDSPGQNTGVDCHALLHGIFPTQGSNPGLPHCRWILYQLSHQGFIQATQVQFLGRELTSRNTLSLTAASLRSQRCRQPS